MTTTESQIEAQLSPKEVIEAMKQFSEKDRQAVFAAFQSEVNDIHLEPLPYVITLRDDMPIDEQLDKIWRQRGPIDWTIIDDIAAKMDIQEPMEELLQSLTP